MGLMDRLREWIVKRFVPGPHSTSSFRFADVYGSQRPPTDLQLIEAYRDTAYFCANLNVNGVLNQKLRLYVKTATGEPKPKCTRRLLKRKRLEYLLGVETVRKNLESSDEIEEVTDHPFLDLLKFPNDYHTQSDLIGGIQLYQELTGKAYVLLESGGLLGAPSALFILPTQAVTPQYSMTGDRIIDYYWYQTNRGRNQLQPEEILAFRMPDPRDPYAGGYAPAQAAWERINVVSKYLSHTQAMLDNRARPDAIISSSNPEYTIGADERTRMEKYFGMFRGRGSGLPYVSSHGLKVDPLNWSPKDMGELTDSENAIHQIARAFDIPLALLDKDANRANADASRNQHAEMAIRPRLRRIEAVFNRWLLPLYSDRIFCCFDDPVGEDEAAEVTARTANLASGFTTINELRNEEGFAPVDWGNEPWLPQTLRQPSEQRPEPVAALAQGKPTGVGIGVGAKAIEEAVARFDQHQLAEFEAARKRLAIADGAEPCDPMLLQIAHQMRELKHAKAPCGCESREVAEPQIVTVRMKKKLKKSISHMWDPDTGELNSVVIEEETD